jgi:hypothetical protein
MNRLAFPGMSLEIPSGWRLTTMILTGPEQEPDADPQMLTANPSQPFQSNIIMTAEPVGDEETAESYIRKQQEGLLRAALTRRDAAPPEKVTLSDGHDGLLTEQVLMVPEGGWVRQLQLMTLKDGVAYTVIASQLEGEPFRRMREAFRNILLSLC